MLYLAPEGGASLRGVISADLGSLGVCMDRPTHPLPAPPQAAGVLDDPSRTSGVERCLQISMEVRAARGSRVL